MKALRLGLVGVMLVLAQGCALLGSVTSGKLPSASEVAAAKAETDRLAALGKQATEHAEAKCKPILSQEIGWEEERAVGGVVGVSLVSSNGSVTLNGMTEKDPAKLNEAIAAGKAITLPDDAKNEITAQVSIIGRNLARYSARPELPWTFVVIDSDTPNALSAPGGYVFVTTGLLKKVTNEAQLAGVLGHEISHIVYKHSLGKYRDGKHKQCIAANYTAHLAENGVKGDAGAEVAKFALKFDGKLDLDNSEPGFITWLMKGVIDILQTKNDQDSEYLTDKTALELVAFAGYDPSEYEKFLTQLGSSGGFLSSHPATQDRVDRLKAQRAGDLKDFANGTAKADMTKLLAPLSGK